VHYRKMLGGGMRQCGVLAAAGYVALTTMVDRLAEDHKNARIIGEGLAQIPGIGVDLSTVQTNMVYFSTEGLGMTAAQFLARLNDCGILAHDTGLYRIRFVTHRHITSEDATEAIRLVQLAAGGPAMT
jgi:threonine aldolase